MEADRKRAANVLAFISNVTTSVLIVFVNKALIDPKKGHAFTFATTLSALHFLASAASIWATHFITGTSCPRLPWADNLYFSVIANLSIASLNVSLLVNSVGFYQIAKLLIIPFVAVMEVLWFQKRFTPPVVASMLVVAAGVAVVTVTDVMVSGMGLAVAGVSVVSSGMQQLLCGVIQRKHKLQAHQLLANTAPVQGAMLLALGPPIDYLITGRRVTAYAWSGGAAAVMAASCSVAVLVNISQFMCLGRFSAVTFQVLGHTKTVLVLLISWLALHEPMSARKLAGMGLAVAGMVAYGHFNGRAAAGKAPETLPLLAKARQNSDGEQSHAEEGRIRPPGAAGGFVPRIGSKQQQGAG